MPTRNILPLLSVTRYEVTDEQYCAAFIAMAFDSALAVRPEPFNSTPMAANSIPFGSPHVRCTPMGVHCTWGA